MRNICSALFFLAVCGAEARLSSQARDSLSKVAVEVTRTNPKLSARQAHSRAKLGRKVRELAFPSDRKVQQGNYNYNGQGYGGADGQNDGQGEQNYDQGKYQYDWWDEEMVEDEFGFDITDYSFKYTGCHNIQSYEYDDENYGSTNLVTERYATFRLCPSDYCSESSTWGCSSNYGEYVVPLEQFLISLIDYNQERVYGFCLYCEECAAIESFNQWYAEITIHKQYAVANAEAKFSNWITKNDYDYDYSDESDMYLAAAEALWKEIRNGNYANNYASQSYKYSSQTSSNGKYDSNGYGNYYKSSESNEATGAYSNYATGYTSQEDSQSWNFKQNQQNYNSNENAWHSMGSTFGSWYGKLIYPGSFDEYGEFQVCWGYYSEDGLFVCLEDDDVYWDSNIYGQYPELWGPDELGFINEDGYPAGEVESCDTQYSGKCYNQYDACMAVLNEEVYRTYAANQEGNKYQYDYKAEEAYEDYEEPTLRDFLSCTAIQVDDDGNIKTNDYKNQVYYAQQWKQNYKNQQQYQQQAAYTQQQQADEYNQQGEGDQWNGQQYEEAQQNGFYSQQVYYIGPYCRKDHMEITLAVYTDNTCSTRATDVTVSQLLGYNPMSSDTNLFPSECISCLPNNEEYLWYEDEDVEGSVMPVCSMLYQLSGKCNEHLQITDTNAYNQYMNNEENMQNGENGDGGNSNANVNDSDEEWCPLIKSLNADHRSDPWFKQFNDEVNSHPWMADRKKMALIFTALTAFIMLIVVAVLRRQVQRKCIPMRVCTEDLDEFDYYNADVTRQESGIGILRNCSEDNALAKANVRRARTAPAISLR